MAEDRTESSEAAAFQGGERVASITPQGEALNQSVDERDRVTAVPKTPGGQGEDLPDGATAEPYADYPGGFGMEPPQHFPGGRAHEGGDPGLDGDAQYGASPLRTARYDQNHETVADIADGKPRSGHHGAQARYPNPEDARHPNNTGHDEQQASRDLAQQK